MTSLERLGRYSSRSRHLTMSIFLQTLEVMKRSSIDRAMTMTMTMTMKMTIASITALNNSYLEIAKTKPRNLRRGR